MFRRAAEKRGIEPAPGTLGILCEPENPVSADFPTENHSNWQFWHLAKNSRPLILDDTPPRYRPIIQLYHSLLNYVGSSEFLPKNKLGIEFPKSLLEQKR